MRRLICLLLFLAVLGSSVDAATYTVKSKVYAGSYDGFADRLTIAAGDLDGDGDSDLLCGYAQGGLIYLRNPQSKLPITPNSVTVLSGGEVKFKALGVNATNVTWSFVHNASSGTIETVSGVYTAGVNSGSIDIIEGQDSATGLKGRSYVNVIGDDDVARAGKAIVLAGRKAASDPLWPTTDYLANMGYNTLLYRGFSKENVQYLNPVPGRDVDGDGEDDDIDLETTFANCETTFTNWINNAGKLFIYMVDHGGDSSGEGYFRLNSEEILTAAQLDQWLDTFQDTYDIDVTLVIDCCYSGSFLDELEYSGSGGAKRHIITACGPNEPTYFVGGGLVSFSDAFFSGVMLGVDVEEAFGLARDAMATYQTAGIGGDSAAGEYLGATFVAGKDIPQIGEICPNQMISAGTSATLWIDDVVSVDPVQRAWCLIVPPSHNPDPNDPVGDLPRLELTFAGGGRYQGSYGGFNENGAYKVLAYAEDIWGSVSLPRQTYVTQTGYEERGIIVAAGNTNDSSWTQINNMAQLAFYAFTGRGISGERIWHLNSESPQHLGYDLTNDVDALPSLAELSNAITNWAGASDRVSVYLVGDREQNGYSLANGEILSADALDAWLDALQVEDIEVYVILEFAGAGGFLPKLTPPPDRTRITVASSRNGQWSCRANKGTVSFSQYFFSEVFSGENIWDAYVRSYRAIRQASGIGQQPLLDDTGDGAMARGEGDVAKGKHIGSAYLTGADSPLIGGVMPDLMNTGGVVTLWVSGITDLDGVSNVWCVITPPDYDGTSDLEEVPLYWSAASNRYENTYSGFNLLGDSVCTFMVMDNEGHLSTPVQTIIGGQGDAFEPDDQREDASMIAIGIPQVHNSHTDGDPDWVEFFAASNYNYTICASNIGVNSDVGLDLYRQEPGGGLTFITNIYDDMAIFVDGLQVFNLTEPDTGIYALRVTPSSGTWGADTEYELSVKLTIGNEDLLVFAVDELQGGGVSPPGAIAVADGVHTQAFNGANMVRFPNLPDGTHTVEIRVPPGFLPTRHVVGDATISAQSDESSFVVQSDLEYMAFLFMPYATVTGTVRDVHTGAWVADGDLSFTARNGLIAGFVYESYPKSGGATWTSDAGGRFPSGVLLPTVDWDLSVTADGYSNAVVTAAVTSLVASATSGVETVWMTPVDANGNGVADGWESLNPGSVLDGVADSDGDGMSDLDEYRVGTDPHDPNDALSALPQTNGTPGTITLAWPVSSGRRYRVHAGEDLLTLPWPVVAGPWVAAPGQGQMSWTDTTVGAASNRFYQIQATTP